MHSATVCRKLNLLFVLFICSKACINYLSCQHDSLSQSSDHIILHILCALTDCPNRFTPIGHHPFSWIIHRTNNYSLFSSAPLFVHCIITYRYGTLTEWAESMMLMGRQTCKYALPTTMCSTAMIYKQIYPTNCTIPHCLDLHQHLYNNSI